jgi:hypothetical protein
VPRLDEDTRLGGILDNLSQGFLAGVSSEWSAAPGDIGEGIRAEMVDDLAAKHFPMCMRNSHQRLRADHRLNHFGRLQYGLFLKVVDPPIPNQRIANPERRTRCWVCLWKRLSYSGESHSTGSTTTRLTKCTSTIFGIPLVWKGKGRTIPLKGASVE